MSAVQHAEALRVLALIRAAAPDGPVLAYQTVAAKLGRDPGNSSRAIAQVCDLLDAAAARAEVPALALVRVRNADEKINPNAWQKNAPPGLREAIISELKLTCSPMPTSPRSGRPWRTLPDSAIGRPG